MNRKILSIWMIALIITFPLVYALSINPDSLSVAVKDNQAQINWTTDKLADGKVSFGETIDKTSTIPETGGYQLKHSVTLPNLLQGTKYFYKVESSDGSFSAALQTFEDFTTLLSAPKNLHATKTLYNEIELAWDKNEKAVNYKIYLNNASIAESSTQFFTLKQLTAETNYEIMVAAVGNQNKESILSEPLLIKTAKKPLQVSFLQSEDVSKTTAKITWITDDVANSSVNYGKTSSLGLQAYDAALTKQHSILLENLEENTKYYYKVQSNEAQSETMSFITIGNLSVEISNIQILDLTKNSAVISWTTNIPTAGEVVYSMDDSFSNSVKGTEIKSVHSEKLTNLLSGTEYFFKIKAGDVTSSFQSFTTNESLGSFLTLIEYPLISSQYNVNISGKSKAGAKLFIFVNKEKTAQVIETLPESGEFKKQIKLSQTAFNNEISGNNLVEVISYDKTGKKDKIEISILLDAIKPVLQVNPFPTYTSNANLNITGVTEPNVTVELFINNASKTFAAVLPDGNFSKTITLGLNLRLQTPQLY